MKKNSKISLFVLTECTNVTDTPILTSQTDTHIPHDIGRACIASRGKKRMTNKNLEWLC